MTAVADQKQGSSSSDGLTGTCKQDQSGRFPTKSACSGVCTAQPTPAPCQVPRNCGQHNNSVVCEHVFTGCEFVCGKGSDPATFGCCATPISSMMYATSAWTTRASRCLHCRHLSRRNISASPRPTTTALSQVAALFPRRKIARTLASSPRARAHDRGYIGHHEAQRV
jgi:hypothetical protein